MLFASSSAQVLIEIGLVLGVLAGVLGWLGRRAKTADPSVLRTIRLSPQHAVYVVAVEDRRLLLGVGQGSAPTLLCDLGDRIKAVRNDATPSLARYWSATGVQLLGCDLEDFMPLLRAQVAGLLASPSA